MTNTGAGHPSAVDQSDEARIEALESELAAARRDLWSMRDTLIGTQAESATLKVENRELQVRIGQLSQALAEQNTLNRIVGRIRRDSRVRMLGSRVRAATRRA